MDKKKRKKLIRAIISAVVILALIAGAVYLIAHREIFTGGNFETFIQNVFSKKENRDEKIYFDVYSESSFATMKDSLAVASDAGVAVFNRYGERTAVLNTSLKAPHIDSGDESAAVWCSGVRTVFVARGDRVDEFEADGPVFGTRMNSGGWIAVCSDATGYKGELMVYNASCEPVFKWYSGEGYLIDAALSPNSQRTVISTLTGTGARLLTFALDNETAKGEYTQEGTLFLETAFISDSRVCALSEESLTFFPFNLSSSDVYDFSSEYLRAYTFDCDGFAVLQLGKHRTGSETRIATVGSDGREIASVDVAHEVLTLTGSGKYIAVAFADNSVVVYNEKLEPVYRETDLIGLRGAYARPDGSAVVVAASEAFVIGD